MEEGTIMLGSPTSTVQMNVHHKMHSEQSIHCHYLGSGATDFSGGQFVSWLWSSPRMWILLPSRDIPGLRQMRLWNHWQSVSWRQCSVNSVAQCTMYCCACIANDHRSLITCVPAISHDHMIRKTKLFLVYIQLEMSDLQTIVVPVVPDMAKESLELSDEYWVIKSSRRVVVLIRQEVQVLMSSSKLRL